MKNVFIILSLIFYLGISSFASDLKKVTLQLQWKHQFEFAGFYAAKEKGYYKDVGLDVDFLEYDGKNSIVKSVLNKKADFGLSDSSIIAEYLHGKDITFVANYFKHSPLVIVAQKNLKTPAMLKGKKVMGVSDNIDNITLKLMLEKFDISLDEIKHIPSSYSVKQFVEKKVDAMALFTTNEIYELDKLGIKYNVFNPSLYGEEYYDVNLFTSKELALTNPDLVEKFKEASSKGWEYALNHQKEIVKLIQNKYNTQEALLFEARQIQQLMFTKTEKIGDIDPLKVRLIAKKFIESGYADSSNMQKFNSFIFNSKNYNLKKTIVLTNKEREWLQQNPIIKIAYLASWPKNINGQNIHIQYLKLLRKYGNLNIFPTEFDSWKDAYSNVLENNFIHGILYLSKSKEREKYFNFLPPYSFVPVNLVVKEKNHTIKSLKDLKNKSIYTLKGSISNQIIKESGFNIKTVSLATEEKLVEALAKKNSKADAILTFNYDKYNFKKNGLKVVKRIQNRYGNVHLGIAKSNSLVYSILKKAHANIPKEELAKIQKFQSIKQSYSFYNTLNSKEKIYLSKKKSITMCVDPDWEPYEKIDAHGNYVGVGADYIKLIGKKIDKKIKLIKTKTWKESLDFAKEGKCEIIAFLNQTSDRDKFLHFTPSMYSEPEVIVAKDDVAYLDGIASLEGKTVGLVKGYKSDEYISKNYPNVKIKHIKNYEDGLQLVSQRKLYATINSLLGTAYLIRKSNLIDVKIAGKTELTNNYKIGIIKSEPLLHAILSKAVLSITEKEKETILSNWISVKFEQGYNYKLFWELLLAVLIIFLLFTHRQRTMKRLNNELKKQVKEQVSQIVEKDRMIFQQNKLTSMGEMIENIAHQWRQPLSQVNSAVLVIDGIAYDSGCLTDEMEKELSDIENATQYMSKTIDDFREFMSLNNSQELFSIYDTFNKCLSIISKPLEYNSIEVQIEIDQSLKIKGLSSEFLQVLIIILNNAKDAIISNEIQNGTIVVKGYEENKNIILSINDNAGGINEKIIDKVFEPYFTTKHKSQGTGLGLYISKMIIEGKFKGKLWIENRNSGACVLMEFHKTEGSDE